MKLVKEYTSGRLLLISFVSGIIVAYPNIVCIPWELTFLDESKLPAFWMYFAFRYIYFVLLFWALLSLNLSRMKMSGLKERLVRSFLVALPAYALYVLVSHSFGPKSDFISTITCQFFVIAVISVFAGHLSMLYIKQRRHEQEIEQLKLENLQSRCDALVNQINPHFFFNSLNSITALIRKKNDDETLEYVNTLSDVFRYILQSDKKGLVTLKDELEFVEAFRYMMGVRYANKLAFDIRVDERGMNLRIPVLSLLPLIDNVINHNRIDSEHIMNISIRLNESDELVVSNPVYPKLSPPDTNGTGLKNLENRFMLMLDREVRIENDSKTFRVYLPLI